MKEKRTLVIGINDFRIGGAQKLMCDIFSRIDGEYFDFHLVTFFSAGTEDTFYKELPETVTVHAFTFRGFRDVNSWRKLYRLLRKINPDVVLSNLFFSNTVFRILKIILGYRVIIVEHNMYINKTFFQKLLDSVLARVTYKIVAVSEQVKQYTAKTSHISLSKFEVIHNGIDVAHFSEIARTTDKEEAKRSIGLSSEQKVVLSVGQLIRQKNHALLVEAFAAFYRKHTEYVLVILGEGILREELEIQVRELGLENVVLLPGIQKDTAKYYAISEFFVLPSKFEGFGIVCIEAMAAGLPVLATHVAGPDEYIKEGENGYFIKHEVADVAKKMELLTNLSDEQKTKMHEAAYQTALTYDLYQTVEKYQKLLGGNS